MQESLTTPKKEKSTCNVLILSLFSHFPLLTLYLFFFFCEKTKAPFTETVEKRWKKNVNETVMNSVQENVWEEKKHGNIVFLR